MATLIDATQTWALWAVLLLAAAVGVKLESTRWGARLSGAVITLLITFALSNLAVIPAEAPVYDRVWSFLVPLAIPLLLFQADLRRILRDSGMLLVAFFFGAVGTVAGTLLAFYLIPLGEHAWQLSGIFSATYIGGTMNYMGTAEAVGLRSGDLLSAGVAADNLMMTVYFLVLFSLPSVGFLAERFARRSSQSAVTGEDQGDRLAAPARPAPRLSVQALLYALGLSALICAVGFGLEQLLAWEGAGILILTGITVLLATAMPGQMAKLEGAHHLGMLAMQVFFATIGASAHIATVIEYGPLLVVFAAIILAVHLATVLIGGKLAGLSLPEVVVASNANMGGPTTAAAMAVARRWEDLVIPAILIGTLGYATATFAGTSLGYLLR